MNGWALVANPAARQLKDETVNSKRKPTIALAMGDPAGIRQIAMKPLGFDRGVTLLGGFPFTPAHGTAYDIAGKGVANVGATRAALLLAARMAAAGKFEDPLR